MDSGWKENTELWKACCLHCFTNIVNMFAKHTQNSPQNSPALLFTGHIHQKQEDIRGQLHIYIYICGSLWINIPDTPCMECMDVQPEKSLSSALIVSPLHGLHLNKASSFSGVSGALSRLAARTCGWGWREALLTGLKGHLLLCFPGDSLFWETVRHHQDILGHLVPIHQRCDCLLKIQLWRHGS